jgi:hypothetical protein
MPREKKDAKVLSIKLATPVYDQLDQFCEESGMNKTVATEKIMKKFFDEYFSKNPKERSIFGW